MNKRLLMVLVIVLLVAQATAVFAAGAKEETQVQRHAFIFKNTGASVAHRRATRGPARHLAARAGGECLTVVPAARRQPYR